MAMSGARLSGLFIGRDASAATLTGKAGVEAFRYARRYCTGELAVFLARSPALGTPPLR